MKKILTTLLSIIIATTFSISVAQAITIPWDRYIVGGLRTLYSIDKVLIGNTATTTSATLEVVGEIASGFYTATSTTATSTLPNISATQILINSDYITDFTGTNLSITNGVLNASGGGGSGTVGTSTNEIAGRLGMWTSNSATPALLGQVATTSLTLTGFPANIPTTLGALVGGSNTTWNWWGLATTSQPASSNLLVSNGTSGVFGVATGTISAGSSALTVTAGRSAIGGALSIDCATSGSGQNGCLSSTDWTTFNGKQATISATWPITLSGAAVGFNGLSTSTAAVIGNIPYFSGVNTFANVATTTASCGGTNTCTAFTVIGSSPITITGSGGSGGGSWSTTTSQVSGQLINYPNNDTDIVSIGSNSTTTAEFWVDPNSTETLVGIGTTSPYSMLSVAGQVVAQNYIATSTTATSTLPRLSITTGISILGEYFENFTTYVRSLFTAGTGINISSGSISATLGTSVTLTSEVDGTLPVANGGTGWAAIKSGYLPYGNGTSAISTSTNLFWDSSQSYLGIGTSTPSSRLTVSGVDSPDGQFQINYNSGGTYKNSRLAVDSTGNLKLWMDGTAFHSLTDNTIDLGLTGNRWGTVYTNNLSVLTESTLGTITSGTWNGTAITTSYGGTGATTLTGLLQGNGTGAITGITGTVGQFPYYNGASTLLATSTIYANTTSYVGIGSTTPFSKLSVVKGGAITVGENNIATSSTIALSWTDGNQQLVRIGTAAITINFSNYVDGQALKVIKCNPTSGTAGTITWGTQVLWPGGVEPGQTTTANKCDVWSFLATAATSTLKIFGNVASSF